MREPSVVRVSSGSGDSEKVSYSCSQELDLIKESRNVANLLFLVVVI